MSIEQRLGQNNGELNIKDMQTALPEQSEAGSEWKLDNVAFEETKKYLNSLDVNTLQEEDLHGLIFKLYNLKVVAPEKLGQFNFPTQAFQGIIRKTERQLEAGGEELNALSNIVRLKLLYPGHIQLPPLDNMTIEELKEKQDSYKKEKNYEWLLKTSFWLKFYFPDKKAEFELDESYYEGAIQELGELETRIKNNKDEPQAFKRFAYVEKYGDLASNLRLNFPDSQHKIHVNPQVSRAIKDLLEWRKSLKMWNVYLSVLSNMKITSADHLEVGQDGLHLYGKGASDNQALPETKKF